MATRSSILAWEIPRDRGAWQLPFVGSEEPGSYRSWGRRESDTTEQLTHFFNSSEVLSHVRLCDPMDCSPPGSSVHGASPGKNTGAGCHALLQGIFQTQGSNPGLLHCRWILYKLSYQGSPAKILKYRYRASLLFRSLCRDLLCFHLLINVTLSERNIFKFYHSLYCTMPVLKADKRAFSSYVES